MTWKKRFILWSIILLTFAVIIIDFPTVDINIDQGPVKINTTLKGPDVNLFGGKIARELDLKLGLDLQGGTRLVLSSDMADVAEDQKEAKLDATKEVIESRINRYGTVEALIFTQQSGGDYQIVVELPGSGAEVEDQINLVKQTAKLEFWEEKDPTFVPEVTEENQLEAYFDPNFRYQPTDVTGSDLSDANFGVDSANATSQNSLSAESLQGGYAIYLDFTDEGATKFNDVAYRNRGKSIAPVLDGQFIFGSDGMPLTPVVNQNLGTPNGKLASTVITGNFNKDEAKLLSTQLKAGALPISVSVAEQRTVEATLGQDALDKSFTAGVVGLILVIIFLIYMYGRYGIAASIALIIYVLISLAIFKLVPVTLTLAGIAGFIMSIGVAVDANILIFERTLEERRKGRNKELALKLGFDKAWISIRDSNVATLIICLILFYTATAVVKGFAITLGIGVLVSIFTAVFITRTLIEITTSTRKSNLNENNYGNI